MPPSGVSTSQECEAVQRDVYVGVSRCEALNSDIKKAGGIVDAMCGIRLPTPPTESRMRLVSDGAICVSCCWVRVSSASRPAGLGLVALCRRRWYGGGGGGGGGVVLAPLGYTQHFLCYSGLYFSRFKPARVNSSGYLHAVYLWSLVCFISLFLTSFIFLHLHLPTSSSSSSSTSSFGSVEINIVQQ